MTEGINGGKNLKIGNQESCREAVSCIYLNSEKREFELCLEYRQLISLIENLYFLPKEQILNFRNL